MSAVSLSVSSATCLSLANQSYPDIITVPSTVCNATAGSPIKVFLVKPTILHMVAWPFVGMFGHSGLLNRGLANRPLASINLLLIETCWV